MMFDTVSINEEKNRKKSLKVSAVLHTLILLLALYPILSGSLDEDPKRTPQAQIVVVDFTQEDTASSSNAEAEASKEGGDKVARKKAEPKVIPTPPTPTPEPKPTPEPQPDRKPVLTTNEPNPPAPAPQPSTRAPMKKWKKRTKPDPKPKEEPKEQPTSETKPSKNTDDSTKKSDKGTGDSNSKDNNKKKPGAGKGNGDSNKKSDKDGKGKGDDGFSDGDFSGEGIFGRRVVHHGDVKSVTSKEGRIVINLCVNRVGKVVFAEPDLKKSTIKKKSVVKKAVRVAKDYRFDTDYTASEKQCGHLTFIFDLGE